MSIVKTLVGGIVESIQVYSKLGSGSYLKLSSESKIGIPTIKLEIIKEYYCVVAFQISSLQRFDH
ncbi:MAG: hypothetical protein O4806_16640 [Trichodesmium sp. St5_bin8]|nr:hypothetical protein [Trichodesmium sp. St4_bin8_1]MDE5073395.1 hypothetical protein [Trichodesmium sp. St5_bin8]